MKPRLDGKLGTTAKSHISKSKNLFIKYAQGSGHLKRLDSGNPNQKRKYTWESVRKFT